ncbi:hypothetical protein ACFL3V_00505 [Nanoarchaeota archaeon]
MKESFIRIDRRLLYVVLLEFLLIALLVIGGFTWNRSIMSLDDDISGLRTQMESFGDYASSFGTPISDQVMAKVLGTFFFSTVLLILFIIAVWTFIKNRIYDTLLKTGFAWGVYWRFVVMSILWGIVSFIIFMVLQFITFLTFGRNMDVSAVSGVLSIVILAVVFFALFWFSINIFTHLVRRKTLRGAVKGLYQTGIRGFGRFLIPLLFSIIILVIINLIQFIFLLAGNMVVFTIISTILLVGYFSWLRFYYLRLIATMAKDGTGTIKGRNKKTSNKKR